MLHMATFWVLFVVGLWLGARTLRRRAHERRRLRGRPTMSLSDELRWLLVLLPPCGLLLALLAYASHRSCIEDSFSAELGPGMSADEYCSSVLRAQFPSMLLAVTVLAASVAVPWTAGVLVSRSRERRPASTH